jgi:hypothetical protein
MRAARISSRNAGVGLTMTEASRRFADGELVGNRYRIERFLAAGGMGEVSEAKDVPVVASAAGCGAVLGSEG